MLLIHINKNQDYRKPQSKLKINKRTSNITLGVTVSSTTLFGGCLDGGTSGERGATGVAGTLADVDDPLADVDGTPVSAVPLGTGEGTRTLKIRQAFLIL